MAQIYIPDELLRQIQQYAQQHHQSVEDVVAEAVSQTLHAPLSAFDPDQILPPSGSEEERQLLEQLRQKLGKGSSWSQQIIDDRGEY